MCFVKIISKIAIQKPNLKNIKKVVFVGPHPDDIEIAAGATVSKLVEYGSEVHFIIATNGCMGTDNKNLSEKELSDIRKKESINAANHFGISSITFLPFNDGGLYLQEELNVELTKKILEISPDLIFGPDPCLKNELHQDHIKVGQAIGFAGMNSLNIPFAKKHGFEPLKSLKGIAYYYPSKPNFYIKTRKKHVQKQLDALSMHKSQVNQSLGNDTNMKFLSLFIKVSSKRNGLKRLRLNAEAFRFLHPIQWHCFVV